MMKQALCEKMWFYIMIYVDSGEKAHKLNKKQQSEHFLFYCSSKCLEGTQQLNPTLVQRLTCAT